MPKQTMLITGGAGFLGSHARAFFDDKYSIDWCDLRNADDCLSIFSSNRRYDVVLHFAAHVGGRAAIDGDPFSVARTINLDVELFRWAERVKPGMVVYPSSSAAYPVNLQTKARHRRLKESDIDLDNPELPDAVYGWVKLTGEQLARRYSGDVAIIRPMSGYAENQDASYPFGAFRDRAIQRESPFVIWGDGTQVRDWVHVSDIMCTIDAILKSGFTGPVNIGTGIPTNFLVLSRLFTNAAKYKPDLEVRPEAPTGVHWRVADPTEMLKLHIPRVSVESVIRGMFD